MSLVLESMTEGEWMVSLDLKDAYFQVPIHPRSHRFFRICVVRQSLPASSSMLRPCFRTSGFYQGDGSFQLEPITAAFLCAAIWRFKEFLELSELSSQSSALQTGVECISGSSRQGPTPLVLPCSPLAQEVRREQVEYCLRNLNAAST